MGTASKLLFPWERALHKPFMGHSTEQGILALPPHPIINGLCSHVTLPFHLDPEVTFSAYQKQ